MSTYDAWELDDIIYKIEMLEKRVAESESEFDASDFANITDNLSRARYALREAWLMV